MPSVTGLIIRGESASDSSSSMPHLSALIIVCSFVGIFVLGIVIWYLIRLLRRSIGHIAQKRSERSVSRDFGMEQSSQLQKSTVILPERALNLSRYTSYESSTRALVRLLEPTVDIRSASPSFHISLPPTSKHSSYASTIDGHSGVISSFPRPPPKRLSAFSGSSNSSLSQFQAQTRIVRQKFTPVLPDELLLRKVGEALTIVKPFDDGWCLVSRLNRDVPTQDSQLVVRGDHLGVVPAWCFMQPVRGHQSQRPVRRSSAGISVEMDAQFKANGKRRSEVLSWSDF